MAGVRLCTDVEAKCDQFTSTFAVHFKLVVFDLDFTLWDCGGNWVDCTAPPFNLTVNGVQDSLGATMRLYPDVMRILNYCQTNNIPMALASRTSEPEWARELMPLLGIAGYFAAQEIYPSSKIQHFKNLQKTFSFPYQDMLFFDDEMRNINEVGNLGVKAVYVEDGLSWGLFSKQFIYPS